MHKLVDDILVFGKTYEELLERIRQVFERCDEWGITLSKGKYQVGEEVIFTGFIVNKPGTRQDPKLVDAIDGFRRRKMSPISGASWELQTGSRMLHRI